MRKATVQLPTARIGIEITRVVREVHGFDVARCDHSNPITIGQRIDSFISEAIERGDELQTVTVHLDDAGMRELADRLGGFDVLDTAPNAGDGVAI